VKNSSQKIKSIYAQCNIINLHAKKEMGPKSKVSNLYEAHD
jgi:hypothetical protein